jgi:small conductance mechanosensitive channel
MVVGVAWEYAIRFKLSTLMKDWMRKYLEVNYDHFARILVSYTIRAIAALLILFIGFWLINRLVRVADRVLGINRFDVTFKKFIRNFFNAGLKVFLFVFVLNFVGVEATSVVALIGAAGLAIGLALQGTLTNFAGGVLLLLFKPFRVGDIIEAQGKKGVVTEIQIFTTVITTPENKVIFIPNSMLSNGIIENHTHIKETAITTESTVN